MFKAKIKQLICSTLLAGAVFLILILNLPVTASAMETVRVGLFPLGNFQNIDEDGNAYGYNIDYLDSISNYTHWNYEYIQCDNWVEAVGLLEAGKIDLLAPAQRIQDLMDRFDYAAYSMGTEFAAIYTKESREDLFFEDFERMAKLQYGGAENSTFTAKFVEEYSRKAGFEPKLTYYKDTSTLFHALQTEEVDAIVTNIMFAGDGIKLLGRFSPLPVYYITQKGNEELLDQLNDAMTTIRLQNPSLEAELMAEYFPVYNNTQHTYEEIKYIKESKEIIIGYEENYAPLSYTDKETGEFRGVLREILDRIQEFSGFTFRYIPLEEEGMTKSELEEQGIQVLTGVDALLQSVHDISLSIPYLETERVVVAMEGTEFGEEQQLTVAVNRGHGVPTNAMQEIFPNITVLDCKTVQESFQAVRNGKADALIQNQYVVAPWLNKPVYSKMDAIPIQTAQEELCIAVLGDVVNGSGTQIPTHIFLQIIDKAIKQIPAKEINSIIIHNTIDNRYHMSLGDVLYQYRYTLTSVIILLSVCMGLIMRSQKMEANKNQLLSQKNRQLSEAIRQAEQANASKSQFLSRMSHEIRTPMNAVVGLTAITRTHKEDPEAVEQYLDKIDSSSKVLLNIINDVLDMSAIESNKLKIAHSKFDIKTILTAISTIYYSQCRQKGLKFVMATDINDEWLIGDSLRLNQILMNLVSNAYKFTEPGGEVRITVKETTRRDQQVFLRFMVSDTGVGMSESMVKRIFKPFEQESAETAGKYGGSGLGLSIAKNLVDMMQGAIKVTSEKGKGTTFTVDLPFEATGEVLNPEDKNLKDINILVVDDDEDAREYTSIILDRIGVHYDVANSGEKAVSMLEESYLIHQGYDICFLDWKMPGMDGVELTRKIRELFQPEMVIIIVSAFDLSEVEEEAKLAGADLFIPKPMFQSTVFDLLMNLSGGKYAKRTADTCQYDFTGYKVLLAEDHPMNREIAVELLHIVHMEVDCAEDGREAVDIFLQSEPGTYELILMDIQMPVMDGHEAALEIRRSSHPEAETIPIYAMTANAFTEDVSAALASGMNGHIAKPIDTSLLYSTLDECIRSQNRG